MHDFTTNAFLHCQCIFNTFLSLTLNLYRVTIHSQGIPKGDDDLSTHSHSDGQTQIADEIIDNAIELPVENQELLLMMAKAMQYTRKCVLRQGKARSPSPIPETDT